MTPESTRLAILSMHTDPLAPLGGDFTGGMNVYVREIAKAFASLGVETDVFTRLESEALEEQISLAGGCRFIRIEAGPKERLDKDAQYAHVDAFAHGILAFAEKDQTRYDGVSAHYWLSGLAGEKLAEAWGVPLALRFHTLAALKNDALPTDTRRESDTRLDAEPRLAQAADALIVSSPAEARAVSEKLGAGEAHVVPCGVDPERFRPHPRPEARARLGFEPYGAYILSVGRIERVKGLDRLIEAFAVMRRERPGLDARLLHVGGEIRKGAVRIGESYHPEDFASHAQGAEVARLESLARVLGVADAIIFLGAKPQEALPLYYSAADLFALPSRYESFGLTAVEAAACGLPTLAFDVGGVSRAVREGVSGYLIADGDINAYAGRMREILETKHERPHRRALAWAESFAWTRIAEAELDIWARLLQEAALSSPHVS
ncbi:glycosyltransferase [Achromobacter marplatensis]|uniref:glycosyltransferase n=1 Tax=Achromobacter marplatensis TaxID=470868 RepID=UPI003D062E9E